VFLLAIVTFISRIIDGPMTGYLFDCAENYMPANQLLSDFTADRLHGLPCTQCKTPLILTRIKQSSLGFDLRTFECVNCGRVEKIKVQTRSAKWRSSHLRPGE
jgi:RNase P subunit RPR2